MERDLQLFCETLGKEIDTESFLQLYRDTNRDTLLKILALYEEALSQCFKKVTEALIDGNAETVWKFAHKVAGTADLLGFLHYGGVARELSHQVKANPVVYSFEDEIREFLDLTRALQTQISKAFPNLKSHLT